MEQLTELTNMLGGAVQQLQQQFVQQQENFQKQRTDVQKKLGTHENMKYTNYILPNKPEEMLFEETIETLSKMFGEQNSLFHTRHKCLNIIKEDDEDFIAYAGKVNAQCEQFKLKDLKEDMFKYLIFVQGLTSNKDKVIRSKILTMLEQDTEITLQKVSEECQKSINIRRDNIGIEEKMLPE